MEYHKKNLLHKTPNESSKFRIKKWFEINDGSCGTYEAIVKLNLKFRC